MTVLARPLRVLHVITAFQLGGAERVVGHLARGLAGKGHAVCVAGVRPAPAADLAFGAALRAELGGAGVAVRNLGLGGDRLSIATAPVRLALLASLWKADIVHAHTDIPDFVTALAARIRPLRVARTIHNSVLWPTRGSLARVTESAFRDDLVIAIGAAAEAAHIRLRSRLALPLTPHRLRIANGIPPVMALPAGERARRRAPFAVAPAEILIAFAGRFMPQKGLDILLDALAELAPEDVQRLHVHAFGSGEGEAAYRARVDAARLPVTFHPPRPGIVDLFPAFDYVAVPSRFEGLGMVAVESLMAGTPVIATRVEGLVEALPPDWPLLAEQAAPGALAQVLRRVLAGGADRGALVRQGQAWAEARFSVAAMVAAHEGAYRRYLAACAVR